MSKIGSIQAVAQGALHTQFSSLGDASNVLLLVPSMDSRDEEACSALLADPDPSDTNLMIVTFSGSLDERLDAWRRHVGEELPANVAVVSVGDANRSTVTARTGSDAVADRVALDFVTDPGDLTGLGMRITERLAGWDDGRRIVTCVHSLTTLLQYVDVERAYRFLHVLSGHFGAAGAIAHYHMDPGAHDARTVNTMKTLMDAVIELDDDGEWTVSTR